MIIILQMNETEVRSLKERCWNIWLIKVLIKYDLTGNKKVTNKGDK